MTLVLDLIDSKEEFKCYNLHGDREAMLIFVLLVLLLLISMGSHWRILFKERKGYDSQLLGSQGLTYYRH